MKIIDYLEQAENWLKDPKFSYKNLLKWKSILALIFVGLFIWFLIDTGRVA